MRNAFASTIIELAHKNDKIFLLTGDLGFTVFEEFMAKFPNRFINCGVAEANMVGIAAGLAKLGKIPFVYSIATFMTMRAFEQIRNDVCLANMNVKIVGVGGGLSYGHAGPTHHSLEDIGLMRLLPNMKVIVPPDKIATRQLTKEISRKAGPMYLRLGKRGEQDIYTDNIKLSIGSAAVLREGKDVTLIGCGPIMSCVLKSADLLRSKGIAADVLDIHTLKPVDARSIITSVKKTKRIITIEEHSTIGGLGTSVLEVLCGLNISYIVKNLGIPDTFVNTVGSQEYLRSKYHLTAQNITRTVLKLIQHE